jgi:hypothetical protein
MSNIQFSRNSRKHSLLVVSVILIAIFVLFSEASVI